MEKKEEKFVKKLVVTAGILLIIGIIFIPISKQSEIEIGEYAELNDTEKIGAFLHEATYAFEKGKVYSAMLNCILAQDYAKNLGATLPEGSEKFIAKVKKAYERQRQQKNLIKKTKNPDYKKWSGFLNFQ